MIHLIYKNKSADVKVPAFFLLILLELIRIYPCLYESMVYNIQCQEMKGLTRCYVVGLDSDLLVCLKLTIAKFYDI